MQSVFDNYYGNVSFWKKIPDETLFTILNFSHDTVSREKQDLMNEINYIYLEKILNMTKIKEGLKEKIRRGKPRIHNFVRHMHISGSELKMSEFNYILLGPRAIIRKTIEDLEHKRK
jgi:hypothetical protein